MKTEPHYNRSLIDASLDPLVTINTEGKITDMNEAFANITGITREKLSGTNFFDYFTESQKARDVYHEVFLKGTIADCPLTLHHKAGNFTDVLFNGSVYKDDKGNLLGLMIVIRALSEKKKLKINFGHYWKLFIRNTVMISDNIPKHTSSAGL